MLQSITLNGVAQSDVVSYSNNLIRLRATESNDLGVGAVHIVSDTGSFVELLNGWTYDVPSDITNVCV